MKKASIFYSDENQINLFSTLFTSFVYPTGQQYAPSRVAGTGSSNQLADEVNGENYNQKKLFHINNLSFLMLLQIKVEIRTLRKSKT